MKKNPIIFIAMLVALAFTSCQMNTDDITVPYVPETPTYTITVTATHGTVTLSKTEAKAGETITVTKTNPESDDYEFDLRKVTIKDANGKGISVNATTKSFVMPASNVTITVEFVKITDGGSPTTPTTDDGEDNNGGEPLATNEYTVSVASGIKGGHIEVSLDNATWTTLSTSTKYAKNTKLYVRAVADKHYEYKDGLRTDGFDGQLNYIMLNSNAELNANFVIKKESLLTASCIITPTNTVTNDYKNSKFRIEVQIANTKFEAGWNKAKIALGFDECYYEELRENLNSSPKYYYDYPTEITSFKESLDNTKKIAYVGINGENFEIPDVGKLYLVLENTSGQKVMYKMYQSDVNKFKVIVE